jgi:hypothetical protein
LKRVFYSSAHGSNPGSKVLVGDAFVTYIPVKSYDRTLNGVHSVLCSLNAEVTPGFKFTTYNIDKENNVGEQVMNKE